MKFPGAGDFEEPFRVPDDGLGKKTAPGKNRERVTQGGRIFGDLPRGFRLFRNQAIEKVKGPFRIGQRRQQRRYTAGRSRRKASEMAKFRARTNRVAELDLFEEIQHCFDYRVTYAFTR